MRIHIIRHADPDYARDDLTALGKSQAEALALQMKSLPLVRIYASPKGRAQATANCTSRCTGIPVQTLEWVREMDDLRTGHDYGWLPDPVVIWDLPGHHLRQVKAGEADVGESDAHFPQPVTTDRFEELRAGWIALLKENHVEVTKEGWLTDVQLGGQDIAIFCHHGVGLALLSLILDIPVASLWRSLWLPPASITTVLLEQYDKHRINPRMVCVGDTGHLSASRLSGNTSGLLYNTR